MDKLSKFYTKIVSDKIFVEFKDGSRMRLNKQTIHIYQHDFKKGVLKDGREVVKNDDLWICYT